MFKIIPVKKIDVKNAKMYEFLVKLVTKENPELLRPEFLCIEKIGRFPIKIKRR